MARGPAPSSAPLSVASRGFVQMLSKEVADKLKTFHMHDCMHTYRCLMRPEDHGPRGVNPPIIPQAEMARSRVFTGTREAGSYNHHAQIARYKGKYFFGWTNGIVHEEDAGQRILVASSPDARSWSEPACVAGDKADPVIAHNCVAIQGTDDALLILDKKEDTIRDASSVGMRRIDPSSQRILVHRSRDGVRWEEVGQLSERIIWIFEYPRPTTDGHLLCVATLKDGAALLRWETPDLTREPEVVPVPQPHGAVFPYGEGSWYQLDGGTAARPRDGTIVVFWRDEGQSCRLWVNYSTDGGKSFSEPMISDIPDSMARVYAGRLADGRYYICNNAFPTLLNRLHLMLLTSDDGCQFNRVYLLADDPTAQRLVGMLKVHGYQYPCCLPERDRLLVGYSVNKEDIECGTVPMKNI